jgi:hypothetical protein
MRVGDSHCISNLRYHSHFCENVIRNNSLFWELKVRSQCLITISSEDDTCVSKSIKQISIYQSLYISKVDKYTISSQLIEDTIQDRNLGSSLRTNRRNNVRICKKSASKVGRCIYALLLSLSSHITPLCCHFRSHYLLLTCRNKAPPLWIAKSPIEVA